MTIDIDPVIGSLGPLEYRWYGLLMALGVIVGTIIFSRQLKRRGISSGHALGIAVIAVPCGVIGARVVHIFDHLGYYLDNPGEIIGTQLVGLAIYGVVGGGVLGLIAYCRWKKLPVWRVVDCTALAFPVGQIIGKFANIINGDTWGYATDLPWGFVYTNPDSFIPDDLLGVPTHPNPVYEQIWLLVMIGILLYVIPKLKVDGLAVLLYAWLYSVGRFFLSYFRVNDPLVWGLREAQVIAIAAIVLAPVVGYWLIRRDRAKKQGPGTPGTGRAAGRKTETAEAAGKG